MECHLIFSVVLATGLLAACGGDGEDGDGAGSGAGGGGGGGGTTFGDVSTPGAPFSPDWQHLFGLNDSQGIGSNNESLQGLVPDGDGGVYVLADRRYRDDPNRETVLLAHFAEDGSLAGANTLRFDSGLSPLGLRVDEGGDLFLVTDLDDLNIIKLNATGEALWTRAYDREPYAFGGLHYSNLHFDDAGNLYVAGYFNPSEPGNERGFVAKLDSEGEVVWGRSWPHRSFFEEVRLSVSGAGVVYVVDSVDGTSEITNGAMVLFGFAAGGETLGQHRLVYDTFDGAIPAVNRAAPLATDDGVTVVGTRSTAVDGDFALFVYGIRFDDTLGYLDHEGARLPTTDGVFPSDFRLTADGAGGVNAVFQMEERYTVLALDTHGAVTEAYDIVRDDGTSPVLEDDDFPILLAAGTAGRLYLGGTADEPGTIVAQPRGIAYGDLPLRIEDAGLAIATEAFSAVAGRPFTLALDELSILDDAEPGDEDVLLLRLSP